MRRLTLVFCVILVFLAATGCGASSPTIAPGVSVAVPWGQGDRAEYTIEANGTPLGSLVFTTQRKDDGHIITTETAVGAVRDVSSVRVDRELRPIGATRQVTGAGKSDFTLMTVYDKGKLTIQAKTADGDKAATINVPPDAWDNDQCLVRIRAMPLADGYTYRYTNVVGASATAVKTTVTVLGREKVEVPAGSFTAYKVELDFGQGKNISWYDVNAPHHIVKYENTPIKQVIVLTKVGTP